MTHPPETPESLGLRLLDMVNSDNCPQDEALALIAAGADVCARGNAALLLAAYHGRTAIVVALIEKGAEIGARNNNGSTALHLATTHGCTATVLALIERGADINAKNDSGNTALHRAVLYVQTASASALIEKGADISPKNNNGYTAETLARRLGYTALADLIPAAHLERATKGFREGLEHAIPVPPPLRVKRRRLF